MTFQTVAQSFYNFLRSHDLDPSLYQIHLTTRSPLALDQLRLALSSDFKHLFMYDTRTSRPIGELGAQPWPRNHFVGWFEVNGVTFRTGFGEPPETAAAKIEPGEAGP